MHMQYDPDEWETVATSDERSASFTTRRRPADEVAKIRARKLTSHQAAVLMEAATIVFVEMPLLAEALIARSRELSHG